MSKSNCSSCSSHTSYISHPKSSKVFMQTSIMYDVFIFNVWSNVQWFLLWSLGLWELSPELSPTCKRRRRKQYFLPFCLQLWMKGSYLLCPQKHALKSSPSVNTSSPNRDFFHNTFFQSGRRNCLHPCYCCLVWLASTYISAWSLCCGSFHLHQFKQENNIGMQKNGCRSYLLIRLGIA